MKKPQPLLIVWWPESWVQDTSEEAINNVSVRYEVQNRVSGAPLHTGHASLQELPKQWPTLVLLPPAEVSLFTIETPKLSDDKLQQALPWLVEPFILNEPEENFVTLWPNRLSVQANRQLACVITKQRARQVLDVCQKLGLQVCAVSSESLRHPGDLLPTGWVSGSQCIVATGEGPPLVAPIDQPQVTHAMLIGTPTLWVSKLDQPAFEALHLPCALHTLPAGNLTPLSNLCAFNLLPAGTLQRAGFRVSNAHSPIPKHLKWSMVLATVVGIMGLNTLAWKAKHSQAHIQQTIEEAWQKAMPNKPMIADPLLLLEREKKLLTQRGNHAPNAHDLSQLLHTVGQAMESAPFNSLTHISWKNEALTLQFNSSVQPDVRENTIKILASQQLQARWALTNDNQPQLYIPLQEGQLRP